MATMLEKFKEVAEKNNEQIKKLQQESAALVKPLLQSFVKEHPQVKQVKWVQYTPYFNDGEACEFGVHSFGFYFDGDDLDDSRYEFELYGEYDKYFKKKEACSRETYEACLALERELNQVGDALLTLFGDHVEVIVTESGVEVEEYDHD
jgi:hypothetical protein